MGFVIGWVGVALGLFVAPPQLYRILKTKSIAGISPYTYIFLCLALICYLYYAVSIQNAIFITTHSIGLVVNSAILFLLFKYRRGRRNG